MRSRNLVGFLTGSLLFGAVVAGTTAPGAIANAQNVDGAALVVAKPSPSAKRFTTADIAKLKWLEGRWKGTGEKVNPFFEQYRFENDSTMAVDSFDDESFSKASDVTRYILKDGQFRTERDGPGYSAVEITADSVSFVPFGGAKNSFTFQRESADSWRATLEWPAVNGKPAGKRIYNLVRIKEKK